MNRIEKWCEEFQQIVPADEHELTKDEATFRSLQGVAYVIDKMVNVGYKGLLGIGRDSLVAPDNLSPWCDLDELCRRHPELRRSNVVSRTWRLEKGFPFKGGYKCRQMFYEPDVVAWINQHMREEKC